MSNKIHCNKKIILINDILLSSIPSVMKKDTLTLFLHSNLYIIVVFKYSYTAKLICVKGERTNDFTFACLA
jgi:hypothetical protein